MICSRAKVFTASLHSVQELWFYCCYLDHPCMTFSPTTTVGKVNTPFLSCSLSALVRVLAPRSGFKVLPGLHTGQPAGYLSLTPPPPSTLCCLQGVGSGFPDAALPAERHLVVGPHVLVGSVTAAGLPLLLPQHGAGPAHHHPALHTGQEGASCHVMSGKDQT